MGISNWRKRHNGIHTCTYLTLLLPWSDGGWSLMFDHCKSCVVSFPVLDVANTTRAAIPAIQTNLKFNCYLRLTVCAWYAQCMVHLTSHKPALKEQNSQFGLTNLPCLTSVSTPLCQKGWTYTRLILLVILHNPSMHFLATHTTLFPVTLASHFFEDLFKKADTTGARLNGTCPTILQSMVPTAPYTW